MNSKQFIETLEQIVTDLKDEAEKPFRMPENVDAKEAVRLLREHLPSGRYVTVQIELSWHRTGSDVAVEFTVYDGKEHHKAKTLSLAVQQAITANLVADASASPVAAVEKALETLQPDPFATPVNL